MKKQVVRPRKQGHRWIQNGWNWTCKSCSVSKRSVQIANGQHRWEYSYSDNDEWTGDCPLCCSASLLRRS